MKVTSTEYEKAVLRLHSSGKTDVLKAYSEVYERCEGESLDRFIKRCAEQDYEDFPYGGCLFEELIYNM